jgi:hypothetical protein
VYVRCKRLSKVKMFVTHSYMVSLPLAGTFLLNSIASKGQLSNHGDLVFKVQVFKFG